jgi:hypothetical protein
MRAGERVSPPPDAARGGLNQHRFEQRPLACDLLEHLPGDVPFSTHLTLENVRARLVQRALGEALNRLGGGGPNSSARVDPSWDRGREGEQSGAPSVPAAAAAPGRTERVAHVTAYSQRRARWPLGGLIDLVV